MLRKGFVERLWQKVNKIGLESGVFFNVSIKEIAAANQALEIHQLKGVNVHGSY